MPYNPHAQNHAGEYIMRGAEIASKAISDGIQGMHQNNMEHDFLDSQADYYLGGDPDSMTKFNNSSIGGKRGMISAAQAQDAANKQQTATDTQQGWIADDHARQWYTAEKGDEDYTPDQATMDKANDAGFTYLPTSKHGGVWQPTSKGENWRPGPEDLKAADDAGYTYLPQSNRGGTFVPKATNKAQPEIGSDPTGTGNFYWDGRQLNQVKGGGVLPPKAAADVDTLLTKNATADANIQNYQAQIAKGSKSTGWAGWGDQYTDLINAEQAKKTANLQQISAIRAALAPAKPVVPTGGGGGGGSGGGGVPAPALPSGPGQVNLNLMPGAGPGNPLPAPGSGAGNGGFSFGASGEPAGNGPAPGYNLPPARTAAPAQSGAPGATGVGLPQPVGQQGGGAAASAGAGGTGAPIPGLVTGPSGAPTGTPGIAPAPQPGGIDPGALRAAAAKAIADGKPRDAVVNRLSALGVDSSGL